MTTPENENRTPEPNQPQKRHRSKPLEFALWALLSIAIAIALVYASDQWLPANF